MKRGYRMLLDFIPVTDGLFLRRKSHVSHTVLKNTHVPHLMVHGYGSEWAMVMIQLEDDVGT